MNKDLINVVSINLGKRRLLDIGNKSVETGIFKQPHSEPITVTEMGLAGDIITDTKNHGGPDQAVYLYSLEDYDYWITRLDRELPPGTFGENLTLSRFGSNGLRIGDKFQIQDVLLEVTFPRIPCARLGARMGDAGFVRQFVQAQRPGVYARVLHPGTLQVGDTIHHIPTRENYPEVNEMYHLWFSKVKDKTLVRRGLEAPISERARFSLRVWSVLSRFRRNA